MNQQQSTNNKRIRRKNRVRARVVNQSTHPRLSIFKSNSYVYVQVIDPVTHTTVVSFSTRGMDANLATKKIETLAQSVAQDCLKKGITHVVFDRGQYKYHGVVKAIAEHARKQGLHF